MKTLIAVSDSHGNRAALEKLFPIFSESDYIFHLGDTSSDGSFIRRSFPDKTYLINGNCDFERLGEKELTLQIEDVRIFACHGDAYGVKYGYDRLAYRAKELDCSVALFGHTHCATERELDGVLLFNPGTTKKYTQGTYLYLVINGNKAVGKICPLPLD